MEIFNTESDDISELKNVTLNSVRYESVTNASCPIPLQADLITDINHWQSYIYIG